jgi:hypothetical protein
LRSSIAPSNIADLLHLAVNRRTSSWSAGAQLVHAVADIIANINGINPGSREQLCIALQQPGLQEALLRTALQREPRNDGLNCMFTLPGMQGLPAAAAVSLFTEVLNAGRHHTFDALCFSPLAAHLDTQGLIDVLRVVMQWLTVAGAVSPLLKVPAALQLESGQVIIVALQEGYLHGFGPPYCSK